MSECPQHQDPFKDISSFGNIKKYDQGKRMDTPLSVVGFLAKNHFTQGAVSVLTVSNVPVIGVFETCTSNCVFYQKPTK